MVNEVHAILDSFNRRRFAVRLPEAAFQSELAEEHAMRVLEGDFVEQERAAFLERAAAAPTQVDDFIRWYEALEQNGPGQHDALFGWLAEHATLNDVRWFLRQEVAGEAGFDDLVALTQIKMPERAKLEFARNYWDELGRGQAGGMHGPMLSRLGAALTLDETTPVVWESLALGNLMIALAANRRYAYQSIGALGVIELTAPGRAVLVNQALCRLGVSSEARRYFALHATLDVKHSRAWNDEVIGPLVAADPRVAPAIAEGALMRLEAGRRCFERYRRELSGFASQMKSGAAPDRKGLRPSHEDVEAEVVRQHGHVAPISVETPIRKAQNDEIPEGS